MNRFNTLFALTIRVFIALVTLTPSVMTAGNGGSGYSRYGIGDLRYFPDGQAMGMGSASIGVLSPVSIDRINPAGWSRINRTRFSISTLYEGFSTSDDAASTYLSQLTFNGAAIAIPIAPSLGITASIGVTPYSRINYNVTTPATQGNLSFNTQYIGDGGVSLGYIGSSLTVGGNIHLGGKLNYYFGTLNYSTKQMFDNSQYASAEVVRASELRGFGFSFGGIYSGLKKILSLPETNSLNVGIVVSTTSYLTATDERFYTYNAGTLSTRDTLTLPDNTLRIPMVIGGGISYATDHLLLAADLYYQHWSRFTDPSGADIRDSYRFGAGGEFIPKRESSAPFTQRIAYRFGGFYNASYYQFHGEAINEIGITGGFGIPVFGETRLNIGAEYSFRGTTNNQLQKDKILRISFTLSGGELWFIRPEQE